MSTQRAELLRYCSDEKSKCEAWCEEQRAAATRDRRAAAKTMRDAREAAAAGAAGAGAGATSHNAVGGGGAGGGGGGGGSGPGVAGVRRERAEIEALHATIEKMKIDAAEARKRSKAADTRLQQLNKELATNVETSSAALSALEAECSALFKSLDRPGGAYRVPGMFPGCFAYCDGSDAKNIYILYILYIFPFFFVNLTLLTSPLLIPPHQLFWSQPLSSASASQRCVAPSATLQPGRR